VKSSKEFIFTAFDKTHGYLICNNNKVLGYSDSISNAEKFHNFESADKFVKSGDATEVRKFEIVYHRVWLPTQSDKRRHFAKIMNVDA